MGYFLTAWQKEGVLAFFSTRRGGVSAGPYASLNLGFGTGDSPRRVLENRRRLAEALELPLERWVAGQQVHGCRVAVVGPEDAGKGAASPDDALPATDGLVTASPGLVLTGYFADCVPLLFFSPAARAVGVVHAGWRGTVAGIAELALRVMEEALGADRKELWAAVGPCIGPCCYTVGEEVAAGLAKLLGPEACRALVSAESRWRADLGEANATLLRRSGIREERIVVFPACTACRHEEFFSFRRAQGVTGRFAALITLL